MANEDSTTKKCSKCGIEKPATLEYFHKARNKCGLHSQCKVCKNSAVRMWYENNREYAIQYATDWKRAHPENNRAISKRWAAENPEKVAVYKQTYVEKHRDRVRASKAKSAKKHVEKTRAKTRNRRAIRKSSQGFHTAADIQKQHDAQHGRCWYCQKLLGDDYHVDHRIALSRGGTNWPNNLVITCPSCNFSKGAKMPWEWIGRLL